MPLRPLNKKVMGVLMETEGFYSSALYAPPSSRRKNKLSMQVVEIGPGCCEVKVGEQVILPEGGWVVVKYKEDDGSIHERVLIEEKLLMGVLE